MTIRLPRFTVGADAFDAFGPELGNRGKTVAVVHGEKAWQAAEKYVLPALQKAGLTASGCILYGKEAVASGLIDKLGGLNDALTTLHKMIEKERKHGQ